jgi:heptaprenyl diphosphate synthase
MTPAVCEPIESVAFLDAVEARLRRSLEAEPPLTASDTGLLLEAARHLCLAGGAKRARPRLVEAFGDAVGASKTDLAEVAVAAELVHAASLLHDDVVDDGTLRRGRPTVNRLWGNTVAVLSGDMLLALAFEHLKPLPAGVLADAVDVVAAMTRAAIVEVAARGRVDLPLERWRAVAEGKTGALFAWCGRAAAHLTSDSDAADRFDRCGRHLGVAFQLADDLKDVLPDDAGKDPLADVRSRNPSYPLLVAAAHSVEVRDRLVEAWASEVVPETAIRAIAEALLAGPALEATRRAIRQEVDAAVSALGPYAQTVGGERVLAWALALARAVDAPLTGGAPPVARAAVAATETGR